MYAVPTCGSPVGEGATRVRTGPEPSEVETRCACSRRTSTCVGSSASGMVALAGEDGIPVLLLLSLMVRPSLVGGPRGPGRGDAAQPWWLGGVGGPLGASRSALHGAGRALDVVVLRVVGRVLVGTLVGCPRPGVATDVALLLGRVADVGGGSDVVVAHGSTLA